MNNTTAMNNIKPFTHMTATPHPAAMAAAQLLLMNGCLDDLDSALAIFINMAEGEDDSPPSA